MAPGSLLNRLWDRYEGDTCLGCSLSFLGCMCSASDTLSHVFDAYEEGVHGWHSLCTFCRQLVKEKDSGCLHHVHPDHKVKSGCVSTLRNVNYPEWRFVAGQGSVV
ncbi:hypothetical protein E2C01_096950 [Portunus trituberculatus]|uniref:Uncharacterized protein n=1 Tax=Portunus trituberculatus TaxID=210409 RepID=A0A5B7JZ57_PORTR|nr:hypothetical protein [Portunus trituberculatus]